MAPDEELEQRVVARAREIQAEHAAHHYVLWPRALEKAAEELCLGRTWSINIRAEYGENASFVLNPESCEVLDR